MRRRLLLSGLGTLAVGASGCAAPRNAGAKNSTTADRGSIDDVRPTTEPTTIPEELTCEDSGFIRHPPAYENVQWGTTNSISLRIDDTVFNYGDTAQIVATNITDDTVTTGTADKFQFELLTNNGWQDVRGHDDEEFDHTQMGLGLRPSDTITWSLQLTEKGVLPNPNYEDLTVCPELVTGRYRFVFFGVEPAVAVAFDLHR